MIFSLYKNPVRNMQQKDYKIELNRYSLVVSTNKLEEILKISPLDDYYYLESLKDHLVKDANFSQNWSLFTELSLTLERLFLKQKHIVWSLQQGKMQIIYKVEDEGNRIKISRNLKGFDPKIEAIGQAITFCKDCLLADEDGQVFLMENLLTVEKLAKVNQLQLTPVIISNEALPKISKLVVLSPFGERVEVSIAEDQQAFYFENWHVLELKTPVAGKDLKTTQIISLNL